MRAFGAGDGVFVGQERERAFDAYPFARDGEVVVVAAAAAVVCGVPVCGVGPSVDG